VTYVFRLLMHDEAGRGFTTFQQGSGDTTADCAMDAIWRAEALHDAGVSDWAPGMRLDEEGER